MTACVGKHCIARTKKTSKLTQVAVPNAGEPSDRLAVLIRSMSESVSSSPAPYRIDNVETTTSRAANEAITPTLVFQS